MRPTTRPTPFRASEADIRALLERGRHRFWRQLHGPLLEELLAELAAWPPPAAPDPLPGRTPEGLLAQWLAGFLTHAVSTGRERVAVLEKGHADFTRRYALAASEAERRREVLDYAARLGAGPAALAGDERAFRRWFGREAVADRFWRQLRETERALCFRLDCLGEIAVLLLRADGAVVGHARLWRRLGLETALGPLLRHGGDPRVATAALRALAMALRQMPADYRDEALEQAHLPFVIQTALDARRDTWLQCEALDLLAALSPSAFTTVASRRLERSRPGDDLFPRRRALLHAVELLPARPELAKLLPLAAGDSSPYLRQTLGGLLHRLPGDWPERLLPELALRDPVPQVRGATLQGLPALLAAGGGRLPLALECLGAALREERDAWVLRVGLDLAGSGGGLAGADLETWRAALAPALDQLHRAAPSLAVRRWAAQAHERLWCLAEPEARATREALAAFLAATPRGHTRRLPRALVRRGGALLGRVLAVLAQEDFGYDVELGRRSGHLTRGHVFGFRLWRLLHEWRNPSPDKRQAYSHTRGRRFFGNLRVPSAIVAELAETRVPGEPLHMAAEDGWRPYLPLLDEVLDCLAQNQTVRIFTSEGVTLLAPPRNPWRRAWARWRVTWNYPAWSRLRNFHEGGQARPEVYVEALGRLGLEVRYAPHGDPAQREDPAVRRFFPAGWALPPLDLAWEEFRDYFVSAYGNTLEQLALYLGAVGLWFLGRHIVLFQRLRAARRRLPLSVGGWGTRGKSGTERLKAALFNALGHAMVAKTTGCEAMFLHCHPFGPLREMFLFRPYDKATIWEQRNVLLFADSVACEVFLWECMALTPSYVDLLQRQWMRDDLATLTNAYPDHEDIQGPAGIDIPEVMTYFVPERAILLTSEEQMLPIFREAARRKQTALHAVGWREAGRLTPDLLERFPYAEHPYNIALVLALAEQLRLPEDFALKEMADRVVPDLGVLKVFPIAPWRGRRLEFINGMSANERFGCLGNWRRVGLDRCDPETAPDTWITVVVNNRADRVARSQVFARVVVEDLEYDSLVLIGNNLNGLLSYIEEAFREWASELGEQALAEATLRRLRLPYRPERVRARLDAMLAGLGLGEPARAELAEDWDNPKRLEERLVAAGVAQAGEVARVLERDLARLAECRGAGAAAGAPSPEAARELLWRWFEAKITVVWDYHATGDQVIGRICDACPPGFYDRILGVQNIKGTGLDFVYAWQAFDQCHRACRQLGGNRQEFARGLADLAGFRDYGVLCEDTVRDAVLKARANPLAQRENVQADLNRIMENLERSLAERQTAGDATPDHPWRHRLSAILEAVLDTGDAVRRRRRADRIYRDLTAMRIDHERAALELKALNKRQKGHWLYERLFGSQGGGPGQ